MKMTIMQEARVREELLIGRGHSYPQGSRISRNGTNFSLYSRAATRVELLLFDHEDDASPCPGDQPRRRDEPLLSLLARLCAGHQGWPIVRISRPRAVGPGEWTEVRCKPRFAGPIRARSGGSFGL